MANENEKSTVEKAANDAVQDAKDLANAGLHAGKAVAEGFAGDVPGAIKDGVKAIKKGAKPVIKIIIGFFVFLIVIFSTISMLLGEIPALIWNGITQPYKQWAYAMAVDDIDEAFQMCAYVQSGKLRSTIGSSLPRSSDIFDFSIPISEYFNEKGHNGEGILETTDNDGKKISINIAYAANTLNSVVFDYRAMENYTINLPWADDGGEVCGDLHEYIFNGIQSTVDLDINYQQIINGYCLAQAKNLGIYDEDSDEDSKETGEIYHSLYNSQNDKSLGYIGRKWMKKYIRKSDVTKDLFHYDLSVGPENKKIPVEKFETSENMKSAINSELSNNLNKVPGYENEAHSPVYRQFYIDISCNYSDGLTFIKDLFQLTEDEISIWNGRQLLSQALLSSYTGENLKEDDVLDPINMFLFGESYKVDATMPIFHIMENEWDMKTIELFKIDSNNYYFGSVFGKHRVKYQLTGDDGTLLNGAVDETAVINVLTSYLGEQKSNGKTYNDSISLFNDAFKIKYSNSSKTYLDMFFDNKIFTSIDDLVNYCKDKSMYVKYNEKNADDLSKNLKKGDLIFFDNAVGIVSNTEKNSFTYYIVNQNNTQTAGPFKIDKNSTKNSLSNAHDNVFSESDVLSIVGYVHLDYNKYVDYYKKNCVTTVKTVPDNIDNTISTTSKVINTGGSGELAYPTTQKTISAGFPYYSSGSYHSGVDFAVSTGTNVCAAESGTVVVSKDLKNPDGSYRSYGRYIVIRHDKKLNNQTAYTLYAHNSERKVNEGDKVVKGQIIAKSGSTGNSTGPHCHFEVRLGNNNDNNVVNPMMYLK